VQVSAIATLYTLARLPVFARQSVKIVTSLVGLGLFDPLATLVSAILIAIIAPAFPLFVFIHRTL